MKVPGFGIVSIIATAPRRDKSCSLVPATADGTSASSTWRSGSATPGRGGRHRHPRVHEDLEASPGCAYPGGASKTIGAGQRRYNLPSYIRPIWWAIRPARHSSTPRSPPPRHLKRLPRISLGFVPHRNPAPTISERGLLRSSVKENGYDLAPFATSRCHGWFCTVKSISLLSRWARQFVSRPAQLACSGCRKLPRLCVPSRWAPQFLDGVRAITATHAALTAASRVTAPGADLSSRRGSLSHRAGEKPWRS